MRGKGMACGCELVLISLTIVHTFDFSKKNREEV